MQIEVEQLDEHTTVTVIDTGHGIAAERIDQLFKPFERLGADPNVEGTGLGLALSKSMLEMMQGQLSVESTPGQGSRFTLRLPHVQVQAPVAPAPRRPNCYRLCNALPLPTITARCCASRTICRAWR